MLMLKNQTKYTPSCEGDHLSLYVVKIWRGEKNIISGWRASGMKDAVAYSRKNDVEDLLDPFTALTV